MASTTSTHLPGIRVRGLVLGAHTSAIQFFLNRFPAPGDYLVAREYREATDGAKGSNQAVAAARLGAQVTLLSAVGDDQPGHKTLDYLRAQGVDVSRVRVSRQHPTGLGAGFYLADGSVMGATYLGATVEIDSAYVQCHQDVFAEGFDFFLASAEAPVDAVLAALALASVSGIRHVILNPSPADALLRRPLPGAQILTPNEPEARLLAGLLPTGDEPMAEVASTLASIYRVPLVLVTMGDQGCYAYGPGWSEQLTCPQVRAVDTSGAGDCFNSSLAICLGAGWPLRAALGFALHAASLSVTRPGSWSAYPTLPEVQDFSRRRRQCAQSQDRGQVPAPGTLAERTQAAPR